LAKKGNDMASLAMDQTTYARHDVLLDSEFTIVLETVTLDNGVEVAVDYRLVAPRQDFADNGPVLISNYEWQRNQGVSAHQLSWS
jgi:hypothetical protein